MVNDKMESTSLLYKSSRSVSSAAASSSNRDDIPLDAESNVVAIAAIAAVASCRRGNGNNDSSSAAAVSVLKRMTRMTTLSYLCMMGMCIVVVVAYYYNLSSLGGNVVVVTNTEEVLERNEKENIIEGTASSAACFGLSTEEEVAPETYFPQLHEAIEFLTKGAKNDPDFAALVQPFGHCLPPSIPVPDFVYGNSDANVYTDAAAATATADNSKEKEESSSSSFGGVHLQFHCVDLSTTTTTTGDGRRSLKHLFSKARTLLQGTGWRSVAARTALAASLLPVEQLIGADFFSATPLRGPFQQDMTVLTKLVEETVDRCVPLLTTPWTPLFDAMYHNACTTEIASRLPPQSLWSVNEKILVFASAIAYQAFSYASTTNQQEVAACFYDAFAVHQGIGFGSVLGVDPEVATTALQAFYTEKSTGQTTLGAAEAWAVGLDLLQHGLQVFLYYINEDPRADAVLEFTKWHWLSLLFVRQMINDTGFPQYMTDFTVVSFQKSFVPLME